MAVEKVRNIQCPFCGCTEFVRGAESSRSIFDPEKPLAGRHFIYRQICLRCGTLVREYIQAPEKLKEY